MKMETKINKWDLIKLKSFCRAKTIKKKPLKKKKKRHGLGEETCGCLMGGGGNGRDRELGLIRHNLE